MRRAAIFLAALALAGCGRVPDADRLLAAASNASTVLATYYEDLGTITMDGWEQQSVFDALQGNSPAPASDYTTRLKAFQTRAELAHRLTLVYQSLRQLHDPAGVAKVGTAGQNLGTAIQGLTALPGASKVPSDQLAGAAQFLLRLKRDHEIGRGLEEMAKITDGVELLFDNEQKVYLSVQADRTHMAQTLLQELNNRKLVNLGQYLQSLHLGLPVSAGTDAASVAAGLAIARIATERTNQAWQCATQHTRAMVGILAATERSVEKEQRGQLSNLEEETAQAAACMKDHDDAIKGRQ